MELPVRPDEVRWASMPLIDQMSNIGSEVGRTFKWTSKAKPQLAEGAFIRALDLFDLTIKYGRCGTDGRSELLKELCRCRDLFAYAYMTKDMESLRWVDRYFGAFASAYANRRGGQQQ